MADQCPDDVIKKKRRCFRTKEEGKAAEKERKRQFDNHRISLGSAWEEWERQRALCGGVGHSDFIHHLLAVHQTKCNTFVVSTAASISQNRMAGDISAFSDVVPETPQKKCATSAIPMPDCSPLLPYTYGKQNTANASKVKPPSFDLNSPEKVPMDISPCATPQSRQTETIVTSTPIAGGVPPPFFNADIDLIDDNSDSDEDRQDREGLDDTTDGETSSEDEYDQDWELQHPPPRKLRVTMTKEQAIKSKKSIVYNDVIEKLLIAVVGDTCKTCNDMVEFQQVKSGTCLIIKWKCPNYKRGHSSGTWASQPMLNGMHAGNLLVPASLALSGNNFAKIDLMAKFLNLNFVSKSTFYRVQQKYVSKAVEKHWEKMQESLLQEISEPVVVAGDGRNDSPGHCAKYCTYSCMDVGTKKIIALSCIDCRQTERNSVVMERLGFKRAIEQIRPHIKIAEIVTDEHPQIRALMRIDANFKNITHQFDVWHVCKNLSKKLRAAGKEKGCGDILKWTPAITNHMWYSAQECGGDAALLKVLWPTCYNHVCDKHDWLDTTSQPKGHCNHPVPLPENEERPPWIKHQSKAQSVLRDIIWDSKLAKKLPFIRNYRHTGPLELFNSLLLMYCPKRLAFTYPIYLMRNQLAALDHNYHVEREYARNKVTGEIRYRSNYSKASKKYSVGPVKVPKAYKYIPILLEEIVNLRELAQGVERLDAKVPIPESDPRTICPNIAAIPRPPTSELVSKHKSRFST